MYKWESVLELYSDAHMFGLKSANSKAVKNSNLAISWLGATFPELTRKEAHAENATVLRAQAYALFDASISLQVLFLLGVLVFLSIASWSISGRRQYAC